VDSHALSAPLKLAGASTLEVSVVKDGCAAALPVRAPCSSTARTVVAEGATDGLGVFAADAVPSDA
jgi:hypothetical protein